MINYFIYRINTDYDGFKPSKIRERKSGRHIIFNWNAYFDALNKGDIILAYFFGRGIKRGIFAITRISKIRYSPSGKKVIAILVDCSINDDYPLVPDSAAPELFSELFQTRLRGAEIVVPSNKENRVYELLAAHKKIIDRCKKNNIVLPGSPGLPQYDITDIPRINIPEDLASYVNEGNIISAFWVKPHQATWIKNSPSWLSNFSDAFGKFKGGDMTQIHQFADAMDDQIRKSYKDPEKSFALISGVPLNSIKLKTGEVDRVKMLCLELSDRLKIRYEPLFSLKGDISRRSYKNKGYETKRFIRDYKKNLMIKDNVFKNILRSGKKMLLVDDVFTDGVTTSTIQQICKQKESIDHLEIIVATLGLMTKKQNLGLKFLRSLS